MLSTSLSFIILFEEAWDTNAENRYDQGVFDHNRVSTLRPIASVKASMSIPT